MNKSITSVVQGGMFNVKLTGPGHVCISTRDDPLVMSVKPGFPVHSDPKNTVAWSSNLSVSLNSDGLYFLSWFHTHTVKFKALFGRSSGEEFQMKFDGDGFVLVQPVEEDFANE